MIRPDISGNLAGKTLNKIGMFDKKKNVLQITRFTLIMRKLQYIVIRGRTFS